MHSHYSQCLLFLELLLLQDAVGGCGSLGSSSYHFNKSKKMSIGIMLYSPMRKEDEAVTGHPASASHAELRKVSEAKSHVIGDESIKSAQIAPPDHVVSPWITPRSVRQKVNNAGVATKTASNLQFPKRGRKNVVEMKQTVVEHAVRFFACRSPPTSDKMVEICQVLNDATVGKENEFAFGTKCSGAETVGKMASDKPEQARTDTLRTKLHEILGTVSSPKTRSEPGDDEAPKHATQSNNVAIKNGAEKVSKLKNLSDTIETDSESLKLKTEPVKGSVKRKEVSSRKPSLQRKTASTTWRKTSVQKNNQLGRKLAKEEYKTFVKEKSSDDRISGPSLSRPQTSRSRYNIAGTLPQVINHRNSIPAAAADLSLTNNPREGISRISNQKAQDVTGSIEKDVLVSQKSSQKDTSRKQAAGVDGSLLKPDDTRRKEAVVCGLSSPTFNMDSTISRSSHSSPGNKGRQDNMIAEDAERITSKKTIRSFRSLRSSKRKILATNDDEEENSLAEQSLQEHHHENGGDSASSREDVNGHSDREVAQFNIDPSTQHPKQKEPSLASVSAANGLESSEDVTRNSEECRPDNSILEVPTTIQSILELYPNKKARVRQCNDFHIFSPPTVSSKAESEEVPLPKLPNETQEDDLQRVVMMFGLALKKIKSKMEAATKRKTSEIIISVSQEMLEQLKSVELQILKDLGQLSSIRKSQKRNLEGKLKEQQEQLLVIHGKFQTEIHQHLQDCKETLEGYEEHQNELKDALKNQKTLHRKLLLAAEESISSKLTDLEQRIVRVQKSSRDKMSKLQRVIADCFKDELV